MAIRLERVIRLWPIAAIAGLGFITAAGAVTRTDLADAGMDQIYGQYAPRGDCKAGPVITIDRTGFSYDVAGKTTHSGKFEFAASFWGNSYDGISLAFFPFVRSDDDYGATTLVVNADEVPGKITVSNDGPPPISAVQRALAKASPFMRCGGAPKLTPAPPAPPPLPALPLSWALLPKAAGQSGTAYDFLHKGEVADAIRALIGPARMAALETRLAVTGPIQRQGSIYYTSGNAEHLGGQEQAYVLFDAARKRVQVGLWEGGKLTVYAGAGGRLPTPGPIAQLVANSPPEDAVALPGTPWELRPVQGRAPIAFVEAAASQKIKSFSLFCDQGRPILAMLLRRRPDSLPVNAVWNFSGWTVAVQMKQGNADGTFWIGDLGTSTLPKDLVSRKGFAYLRLTGDMQGQASLAGAPGIVRSALKGCYRF